MSAEEPALLEHCMEIYNLMLTDASSEVMDGVTVAVWEGFTTKLFRKLNLATPMYTNVLRALRAMDCIRQVKRGGGTSPSKWLLVQLPTRELFDLRNPRVIPGLGESTRSRSEQGMQHIRDIDRRLKIVEKALGL